MVSSHMTNSAARDGGASTSLGGVGHIGDGANPMARVSSGVSNRRDAGGTHAHTLAETPEGERPERRGPTLGGRRPVPSALGDGAPRRPMSGALTRAGGVPWQSPCRSVSRPPGHNKPRRLRHSWPVCAPMWRPSPMGIWLRTISPATRGIGGPSGLGQAWIGGGIAPPWPPLHGSCARPPIGWPATLSIHSAASRHSPSGAVRSRAWTGPGVRIRTISSGARSGGPWPRMNAP